MFRFHRFGGFRVKLLRFSIISTFAIRESLGGDAVNGFRNISMRQCCVLKLRKTRDMIRRHVNAHEQTGRTERAGVFPLVSDRARK
eukprot:2393791-Pyramimonas_sp.AAC.1